MLTKHDFRDVHHRPRFSERPHRTPPRRFFLIEEYDDGARLELDTETGRELWNGQIDDSELDAQIDADAEAAYYRDQMAKAWADFAEGKV